MNNNLGEVLVKARVAKGLTQRAVANNVGITPMFLSQLESGKKIPTTPNGNTALEKIADFYNISYPELLALAMTNKNERDCVVIDAVLTRKMALARTILSRPISSEKIDEILEILKEE